MPVNLTHWSFKPWLTVQFLYTAGMIFCSVVKLDKCNTSYFSASFSICETYKCCVAISYSSNNIYKCFVNTFIFFLHSPFWIKHWIYFEDFFCIHNTSCLQAFTSITMYSFFLYCILFCCLFKYTHCSSGLVPGT